MLEVLSGRVMFVSSVILTGFFLVGAWLVRNQEAYTDEASVRIACRRLFVLTGMVWFFHIVWSGLLSFLQYRLWQQDALTRVLLKLPLDSALPISNISRRLFFLDSTHGYFLFYIWGRFWWPVVVSLLVFGLFTLAMWAWRHWSAVGVSRVEIWFLLLMAAVLGWPRIGIAWMSVVMLAFGLLIGQRVFRCVKPPSLFLPTIVSGLWVLWFGMQVIVALGAKGLIP